MTQAQQIKIPFAIKCDNFEFTSRFSKKEITEYFFRILYFNIDTLDLNDAQVMANFKTALITQLLINSALKNLQTNSELKKLKLLAPKAFKERFDDVQFTYLNDKIEPKNVKIGFSDSEANSLSSHSLEDGSTIIEKYYEIRANAIITYQEVIKGLMSDEYIKQWCEGNGKDYFKAHRILRVMEDVCISSFHVGYISSYQADPLQVKINDFINSFHSLMKEKFKNIKIEKNIYAARLSVTEHTLGINDDLTSITMQSIEKVFPNMWAQIEKLRIKGLIVEKPLSDEGEKSGGKKYKI